MKKICKFGLWSIIMVGISYGIVSLGLFIGQRIEMKQIEEQLSEKYELFESCREKHEEKLQDERDELEQKLVEIDDRRRDLEETVDDLEVTGIGDSVMLGAALNLEKQFKNGYFDAKVSRSIWAGVGLLEEISSTRGLGDVVVINLGANGDCTYACKVKIIEACKDKEVFWLTVTNDENVHVNDKLKDLATKYDNLHIVDWEKISSGHEEYFYSDGIHLTGKGRIAYTEAVRKSLIEVYEEKFDKEKARLIEEFDRKRNEKVTFFGNDILLYNFEEIEKSFSYDNFNIDERYDFNKLLEDIKKAVDDGDLSNRVVFAFDEKANLRASDYEKLIEMCGERQVFVLLVNDKICFDVDEKLQKSVHTIDFSVKLDENRDYLLKDGVHLSNRGNVVLKELLIDALIE